MLQKYDVVIVGAALNGLTMALALGGRHLRRPLSVAVIDMRDPRDGLIRAGDGRASAITQASRRMFEVLGAWNHLADHAQPVSQIIVTDAAGAASDRPVLLRFDDERAADDPAMLLFENKDLLQGLIAEIEASPRVNFMAGVGVEGVDQTGLGLATVRLLNGQSLKTSLVVAADGAQSPLRAAAGIGMVGWSYGQMGLVATFRHDLPHGQRAEEHFGPQGPFAILPLMGNRCSIVWTCSVQEGKRLLSLAGEEFEQALAELIGPHLGTINLETKPQGFPLGLWMAKDFTASRLALIGDAAHIIHPLAGLGFNLGLKDVAALAECVGDAFALGLDIGSTQVLQRYTAWRRFDCVATAAAMDAFNRTFSNGNPVIKLLRGTGLSATDRLPMVKKLFMQEAAGITGQVPKLLRGTIL